MQPIVYTQLVACNCYLHDIISSVFNLQSQNVNVQRLMERAGGVKVVAVELGLTTQAIYKWQRDGYIPLRKIRAVAKLSGIPEDKIGMLIP